MTAPQTILQHSPPSPLSVLPDGIPEEIRARPQWINWRYALDEKGEWTKHPYDPRSGYKAKSTDLMTWSPFEDVLTAYNAGKYAGIGFVFCSGDPYTGVDLDKCRNLETGEIERWAAEIVYDLNSYTEISPSGKGLHIIVKGKTPAPLKRNQIEMYSIERYFTFTGHVAGVKAREA